MKSRRYRRVAAALFLAATPWVMSGCGSSAPKEIPPPSTPPPADDPGPGRAAADVKPLPNH